MVAQSDMFSVRGTWLAQYEKSMRELMALGEDDEGQAIFEAERAVRRAHGSTAITNLPGLVARGGPLHSWLTTLFGFFGTVLQRRIEIAHLMADTYRLGKQGEINSAARNIPKLLTDIMVYVVIPTWIEEKVTGLTTDDKRGWGQHLLFGGAMGMASSFLYVRDIVHSWVSGQEPGVGLISSPLHDITRLAKDVAKGKKVFTKEQAGKTVGDALTVFGEVSGMYPKTAASATRYGIDLLTGHARGPKTVGELGMGITRGQYKKREVK